jgi:hypothetical protein
LLPHLGSRLITGWLYNSAGSSVLITGLFHSMHNAISNSAGLVAFAPWVALAAREWDALRRLN